MTGERPAGTVTIVDGDDIGWERHGPTFRVHTRFPTSMVGVSAEYTCDVTGAHLQEVMQWAQFRAGARGTFSLALVCERPPQGAAVDETGRGLVWLHGPDAEPAWESLIIEPVAARHRTGPAISVAGLSFSYNNDHHMAQSYAWELLVQRREWRQWVRDHLYPEAPFLYLAIRDGLARRTLRKTKNGVSMHLPIEELEAALWDDRLVELFLGVIHAIYTKWSTVIGCPPPPPLPVDPGGHV